MNELLSALTVAVVFYVILPLSGAFLVRRRWRVFRKQVVDASTYTEVTYADPLRRQDGDSGFYSFCGELQAIQDDSCIWLKNDKVSVRAEMKNLRLFLLPSSRSIEAETVMEQNKSLLPKDMPKRIKWERVYSLPQGTGIQLAGRVFIENGVPVFRNTEDSPLLAIIYDGRKETILRRSIWSGRQLNEYWNTFTPLSLISGSFFLFVLSYIFYRRMDSSVLTLQTILLTFMPLIPFFPPGIIFYFLFRRLWRSARYLRGERDLLRLPLRFSDFIEIESCTEALRKYPDAKIRSCGVIDAAYLDDLPCRVYLSEQDNSIGIPGHFFENLIVPGDPEVLAGKSRSRARGYEFLAAASISTGFIVNLLLFYFILIRFI